MAGSTYERNQFPVPTIHGNRSYGADTVQLLFSVYSGVVLRFGDRVEFPHVDVQNIFVSCACSFVSEIWKSSYPGSAMTRTSLRRTSSSTLCVTCSKSVATAPFVCVAIFQFHHTKTSQLVLFIRPGNKPIIRGERRHVGNLELIQLFGLASPQVTCGYASDALTQFLSTGLTDTQLARMRKAVDTGTGQVLESPVPSLL